MSAVYPTIRTLDYDRTCEYAEGQRVYLHKGRFTTVPQGDSESFALVSKEPNGTYGRGEPHELELLLVGESWDVSAYRRYQLLTSVTKQRTNHSKVVILGTNAFDELRQHAAEVFEPATKAADRHVGLLYGLVVYVSDQQSPNGVSVY